MKIFLTGATGFIGKNLLKRLEDEEIYCYKRGEDVFKSVTKFRPDVIFHLAGEIYKDEEMFNSNIYLTYQLLEVSKFLDIKSFIQVGSSSEYGAKKHSMKEIDFLDPRTMYEATKGAETLLCQAYARSNNVPTSIARPFSVYGPEEPEHRFIPTMIRKMKEDDRVEVSPGNHDFIYIDDFIDGLILLMENPQNGEIYNFGTGVQHSNIEVAEKIRKLLNSNSEIIELDYLLRPFDTNNWVADNRKAISNLGWKVKHSLTEGLRKLI